MFQDFETRDVSVAPLVAQQVALLIKYLTKYSHEINNWCDIQVSVYLGSDKQCHYMLTFGFVFLLDTGCVVRLIRKVIISDVYLNYNMTCYVYMSLDIRDSYTLWNMRYVMDEVSVFVAFCQNMSTKNP